MKKRLMIFLTMLIAAVFLCSCGSGVVVQKESRRRPSTGTSWTVMMYLCGSTLEEEYQSGSRVLESLAYDLPENINVVVETGGSRVWHTNDVYSDYQQDYVVQKDGIRLVNQSPSADMGSDETLRSFLSWGIKTYPADHYIAVIWDHGAGPLGGVAFDSAHDYDSLTLKELKNVLSGLSVKLDLVGFDASLMSSIETASALSLYADYMVGAEDIMPMSGWDYNGLFDFLSNNPDAAVPAVGGAICDGVMRNASEQERNMVSMAVTDLSKATTLSLQLEGLAGMMDSSVNDLYQLNNIAGVMNEMEYMGGNSPWEGYSNMIDLGNLAAGVSGQMGDISANINNILSEMVVYKSMSAYHSGSSGLSLYYPRQRDGAALSKYKEICVSNSYMSFLEKTCINTEIENRSHVPEEGEIWEYYNNLAYENILTAAPDMNGHYVLTALHPEILTGAKVNFYMYSADHASYLYLYSDDQPVYDTSVNGFVYEFGGRLPMLNSIPVSMYPVSRNAYYDLYSIPVVYEGSICNIRVLKSKMTESFGEYTILGVWRGVDPYSGMAQREYKKLNAGDVIIPIYRVYGKDETSYVEGNKIRVGFGGIKITEKRIGEGDYIVSYTAEDVYGVQYECATNNLVSSKGSIKIMDY